MKLVGYCSRLLLIKMQSENVKWKVTKTVEEFSTACHPEQRAEVSYPGSAPLRRNLSSLGFPPEPLLASECRTTVLGLHSPLLYATMPQSLRVTAEAAQTILEK